MTTTSSFGTFAPGVSRRRPRLDLGRILTLSAVVEVVTGVVALIAPDTLVRWLLGPVPTSSALVRCFGVALVALGTACWPTRQRNAVQAVRALVIYNALIALYLAFVGAVDHLGGALLWPAAVLHGVVAWLLVWRWRSGEKR